MPLTPQQQARINAMWEMAPSIVPTRFSVNDPWRGRAEYEEGIRRTMADWERDNASKKGHNRLVNIGRVASAVPFAMGAGSALAGLYGGGAAAPAAASGAGWSMPGVSAPVFGGAAGAATGGAGGAGMAATAGAGAGKLATLGKLFSSPGLELGVNAGLTLLGNRSANKAADQARADQMAQYRESIALQRQQLEMEARNADLDREDARALNAAINELKKRELDAAEEERAFNRSLIEQRETRMAPYRRSSEAALQRLNQMWGLG